MVIYLVPHIKKKLTYVTVYNRESGEAFIGSQTVKYLTDLFLLDATDVIEIDVFQVYVIRGEPFQHILREYLYKIQQYIQQGVPQKGGLVFEAHFRRRWF